jgi:hypothetical protein
MRDEIVAFGNRERGPYLGDLDDLGHEAGHRAPVMFGQLDQEQRLEPDTSACDPCNTPSSRKRFRRSWALEGASPTAVAICLLERLDAARACTRLHGVERNARFEVGTAKNFRETGLDLVTFFDCLHDMGDPTGAAAHVRRSRKPDGS